MSSTWIEHSPERYKERCLDFVYALAHQHDFEPYSQHIFVNELLKKARSLLGDFRDWDGKLEACYALGVTVRIGPDVVGLQLNCGLAGYGSTAQKAAESVFLLLGVDSRDGDTYESVEAAAFAALNRYNSRPNR